MNEVVTNGKVYPLWNQFVTKKDQFIGGVLVDTDMGLRLETEITDITLTPNGEDSAFFSVVGKDFTCGFDVRYGGVTAGASGWVTFRGYGGHTWKIQARK